MKWRKYNEHFNLSGVNSDLDRIIKDDSQTHFHQLRLPRVRIEGWPAHSRNAKYSEIVFQHSLLFLAERAACSKIPTFEERSKNK
jgi:hypothetical protein